MKKTLWTAVFGTIVSAAGLFAFLQLNPPLADGMVGSSADYHSVVVQIGNDGFREMEITNVFINDHEQPDEQYIQRSNSFQGFVISDNYEEENAAYGVNEVGEVAILPDTSPSTQLEKVNNGTATEEDEIYGVTLKHDEPIQSVQLEYRYLGMSFEEEFSIDH